MEHAPNAGHPHGAPSRIGLATQFSLAVAVATATFMCLLGAVVLVAGPGQSTEWLIFALAIVAVMPAAALAGPVLAARLTEYSGADAAFASAGWALTAAGGALIASRLLASVLDLRPAIAALLAGAALLALIALPSPRTFILPTSRARAAWASALLALALAPFAVMPSGRPEPGPLAICLIVAGIGAIASLRIGLPSIPRGIGIALDLVVVAAVLLTVPDLTLYATGSATVPGNDSAVLGFHMNFLLGPANDVLAGRPVLVETSSQYGVGPIYLLAALFELVPIGYGMIGLFDGLSIALSLIVFYATLRLAGSPRFLAAVLLGVTIAVTVFNVLLPVAGFPQLGPLRFGLPLVVVLAAAVGSRWPHWRRRARAAAVAAVGLASIWSIETLVYTAAALGAVMLYEATTTLERGAGGRRLLTGAAIVAGACALAHALLAGLTLLVSGELPDWGIYLSYFKTYAIGDLSDLVGFGFERFSIGFAAGAVLFASLMALVVLIRRHDGLLASRPTAIVTIVAATGYAIGEYTYFVGHSPAFALPYVSLPTFLVAGLWLGLLLDRGAGFSLRMRRAVVAMAAWVAALLFAGAWAEIKPSADRSPLGYIVSSDASFRDALTRLWDSPVLDARAPEGERLVEQALPASDRALVLTEPDLGTEILLRSGRVNLLQLGHPRQDDLIRAELTPVLGDQIAALSDGTRMLTQQSFLDAPLPADPLTQPVALVGFSNRVPLEMWILQQIEQRFTLRPVARGTATGADLVVVRLVERDQSAAG